MPPGRVERHVSIFSASHTIKNLKYSPHRNKVYGQALETALQEQLQQRDQSDLNRYQHALETLLRAEKEAVAMIEEVKTGLADHTAKGALLKKDPAVATAEDKDKDKDKDKGKQRQVSEDPPEAVGSDDRDLPHSPAADEHGKKTRRPSAPTPRVSSYPPQSKVPPGRYLSYPWRFAIRR